MVIVNKTIGLHDARAYGIRGFLIFCCSLFYWAIHFEGGHLEMMKQ
jgi:hypothetical protein